jgi:DNA/RNA-binding domain of Phe-tRNA-synthetase-like protein
LALPEARPAEREQIDMAVFAAALDFVRIALRLSGSRGANHHAARALLQRASAAAAVGRGDGGAGSGAAGTVGVEPWRKAYAAVGLSPELVPPHEALAAWARHRGGVPSRGAIADVVHAFSLRMRLPAAAYDLRPVVGALWLRPARGIESGQLIGEDRPESVPAGELILADDANQVLARDWHGRQGVAFQAVGDVSEALVHVDVLAPGSGEVERLAAELAGLLGAYARCEVETRILAHDRPRVRWTT